MVVSGNIVCACVWMTDLRRNSITLLIYITVERVELRRNARIAVQATQEFMARG